MHRQSRVPATAQGVVPRLTSGVSRSRVFPSYRVAPAIGVAVATCAAWVSVAGPAAAFPSSAFLSQFNTVTTVQTTIPENGDVNPYGIVNVPQSTGLLVRGDTLISPPGDQFRDGRH
jgi:hypothetical protein